MKIKYRQRIYIYIFGLFTLFSVLILVTSINKEKNLKKDIIKEDLIVYADIVDNYIQKKQLPKEKLDELDFLAETVFPKNYHLSVLDEEGYILYDNQLPIEERTESKLEKIEVKKALINGSGWNMKKSSDSDKDLIYYAVHKNSSIIRIGMPHTEEMKSFLKPDYIFITFSVLLFILVFYLLSLIYINTRKSIGNLKKFVSSFRRSYTSPKTIAIEDDEIGEIQSMIVDIYKQLEINKKDILLEREKLLEHFHFAEEGISFFTPTFENIYTNSHFIQYLNILTSESTFSVNNLFKNPVFNEVVRFLENPGDKNSFSGKLHIHERHFSVHVIIFDDKSFEIIIRDISDIEKNNFDRATMTNNIAHELRTPVTSVRGYLETILEHKNISMEKKEDFIKRAYKQIVRLTEIIQDVTLLSKTMDAPQFISTEDVNIHEILMEMVEINSKEQIEESNATVNIEVPENVIVNGNQTLLYSIFHNLGNNALKYAGENITITIRLYMEDKDYYYFSFFDNGKGVEEKNLDYIFERFYRVTEGRTRDKGGSGLGLSIVKDAVNFHHGEIVAKNRPEGGLEFLFTLRKK